MLSLRTWRRGAWRAHAQPHKHGMLHSPQLTSHSHSAFRHTHHPSVIFNCFVLFVLVSLQLHYNSASPCTTPPLPTMRSAGSAVSAGGGGGSSAVPLRYSVKVWLNLYQSHLRTLPRHRSKTITPNQALATTPSSLAPAPLSCVLLCRLVPAPSPHPRAGKYVMPTSRRAVAVAWLTAASPKHCMGRDSNSS